MQVDQREHNWQMLVKVSNTILLVLGWLSCSYLAVVHGTWRLLLDTPAWLVRQTWWNDNLGLVAFVILTIGPPVGLALWPFGRLACRVWGERWN